MGLFTKATLQGRYSIRGNGYMTNWLKKYDKFTYDDKLSLGRPMKYPQSQRIKALEVLLVKKDDELMVFKKFIEIAERELE